eukprot:6146092-Prymnesium_polylepis.1
MEMLFRYVVIHSWLFVSMFIMIVRVICCGRDPLRCSVRPKSSCRASRERVMRRSCVYPGRSMMSRRAGPAVSLLLVLSTVTAHSGVLNDGVSRRHIPSH